MAQVIRRKKLSKKQVVIVEKKKQPIITTKHKKSVSKNQEISEKDTDVPGNMEITLKISELPEAVTIQNDWRAFVVEGDNYQARVMLKPRFWSKIESASKDYPSWIAVITGKISKLKDNCFEMPQASAQVFEKKVKE